MSGLYYNCTHILAINKESNHHGLSDLGSLEYSWIGDSENSEDKLFPLSMSVFIVWSLFNFLPFLLFLFLFPVVIFHFIISEDQIVRLDKLSLLLRIFNLYNGLILVWLVNCGIRMFNPKIELDQEI